jgi:hypothetical protein
MPWVLETGLIILELACGEFRVNNMGRRKEYRGRSGDQQKFYC